MFIRHINTEVVDTITTVEAIITTIATTVQAIIMRIFITTIIGAVTTITIGEIISIIMGDDVIMFITHGVSFGAT
jgi:hypothetical protein